MYAHNAVFVAYWVGTWRYRFVVDVVRGNILRIQVFWDVTLDYWFLMFQRNIVLLPSRIKESKKIFLVGWLVVSNILKALCFFEMSGAMNLATVSHSRTPKLSAALLWEPHLTIYCLIISDSFIESLYLFCTLVEIHF